jgi:class 3 adenylate cyclase
MRIRLLHAVIERCSACVRAHPYRMCDTGRSEQAKHRFGKEISVRVGVHLGPAQHDKIPLAQASKPCTVARSLSRVMSGLRPV